MAQNRHAERQFRLGCLAVTGMTWMSVKNVSPKDRGMVEATGKLQGTQRNGSVLCARTRLTGQKWCISDSPDPGYKAMISKRRISLMEFQAAIHLTSQAALRLCKSSARSSQHMHARLVEPTMPANAHVQKIYGNDMPTRQHVEKLCTRSERS